MADSGHIIVVSFQHAVLGSVLVVRLRVRGGLGVVAEALGGVRDIMRGALEQRGARPLICGRRRLVARITVYLCGPYLPKERKVSNFDK